MLLQAKEHQRVPVSPEAKRKAWDTFSPKAFRENMTLLTLWFLTLASRTVRDYVSAVLSHSVCGMLIKQPQETDTVMFLLQLP